MLEVLCIGAAHWDYVARTEHAPARGCDLPGTIARRPGGVAFSIARGLAAEGIGVELVASVGRDVEGDRLVAEIGALGIGTRYLHRGEVTDRYLAIEGPDGELFGSVADCRALESVGDGLLAAWRSDACSVRYVVIDGNLGNENPVGAGDRGFGAMPVYVPASPAKIPAFNRDGRNPGLMLANRKEAEVICQKSFSDSLEAARALARFFEGAAVTDGANPAAWVSESTGAESVMSPPAVAPRSVTGAGDAFVAGFLACAVRNPGAGSFQRQLRAGLDAAARHVSRGAE